MEANFNNQKQYLLLKAKRILICGAGPVGMTLAIELALKFPDKDITVIDLIRRFEKVAGKWKNREYPQQMKEQMFSRRRSQVLSIRDDCRDLFPFLRNILLQRFPCRVWATSANVSIRQLEDVLMDYAQSYRFTNIKLLFDQGGSGNIIQILNNQNYDIVVGCDGAGSKVRQLLAPKPSTENLPPGCMVQQKNKRYVFGTDYILGAAIDQGMQDYREQNQRMAPGEKLYHYHALLTMTQMRFLLNGYYPPVSNNNDAKGIRGFLNIRLSKQQYFSLLQAGKQKGVKCIFTDPALTTLVWTQNTRGIVNLTQSQKHILISAFSYYGLNATQHCGFIYLFELKPAYASKFGFIHRNNAQKEIPIFLCGDAAISHNFWTGRGLNTGLKSASFLLDCLCYPTNDSIKHYNSNMQRLATREIVQRSSRFCQFNGKNQPIKHQMSLFDKLSGANYISPTDIQTVSNKQIENWIETVYNQVLQLKVGVLKNDGTRSEPTWPKFNLSTNKQILISKLNRIIYQFNLYLPRFFRNVIRSGPQYSHGSQPEVYSENKQNRIKLFQLLQLQNPPQVQHQVQPQFISQMYPNYQPEYSKESKNQKRMKQMIPEQEQEEIRYEKNIIFSDIMKSQTVKVTGGISVQNLNPHKKKWNIVFLRNSLNHNAAPIIGFHVKQYEGIGFGVCSLKQAAKINYRLWHINNPQAIGKYVKIFKNDSEKDEQFYVMLKIDPRRTTIKVTRFTKQNDRKQFNLNFEQEQLTDYYPCVFILGKTSVELLYDSKK